MLNSNYEVEECDNEDVPSHILVQRQLQDVILAQQKTIDTLRERLIAQESMVQRQHYDALVKDLEDERISHAKTKSDLMDAQDRLSFTDGELKILQGQLEQEKDKFVKTSGLLKSKALKETKKSIELENKCHEISLAKEHKTDIVHDQTKKILTLSAKLAAEQYQHEQHRLEAELDKQHQIYINQVMEEKRTSAPKLQGSAALRRNISQKHGKS